MPPGMKRSPRGGYLGRLGSFEADAAPLQRGRKLGSDDLQLLVLDLLAAQPSHGYELIQALAERSGGFYKPSPGMIYPALTYLEETGLASADPDGNRKRYQVSEAGRERLRAETERLALLWAGLRHAARKMDWMRRALAGEPPPDPALEDCWLPEFVEARQALKRALLLRTDAPAHEQRRIAAILQRTLAEIEAAPRGNPS